MKVDMNRVILSGHLTRDPETKFGTSGIQISNFAIACNRNKEQADFFDCTAFKNTAEFIEKYFQKGSPILVEGRLQQDRWKTPDGENRSRVKVIVNSVFFMGGKSENVADGSAEIVDETSPKKNDDIEFFDSDNVLDPDNDDIPF
jgi:single-strand DNA-binding protein